MNWYEKAVQAANRIDAARAKPWKLATIYALLSIAESLAREWPVSWQSAPARQEPTVPAPDSEIFTLAEVAQMTRQQPSTLWWWRALGQGGPKSFKLGRRVMYRRVDVEKWLEEAQSHRCNRPPRPPSPHKHMAWQAIAERPRQLCRLRVLGYDPARKMPTICPQLQIAPITYSYMFLDVGITENH